MPQQTLAVRETEDPWIAAMRAGDFAAAWRISDAILRARVASGEQCWQRPRHLQFIWRGQPLAGKRVLVRCYHGLGDTLQFIRFARPLRAIAAQVLVWCQPALIPLVRTAPGVDAVLALTDGAPDIPYDVDIEIMELWHALRVDAEALARDVPYLSASRTPDAAALARDRPNVGLVWQAGDWDQRRSAPAFLIRALAETRGVNFVSLQRGAAAQAATELGLRDVGSDDCAATASLIDQLDLTITVDTMIAHLAGALGRPVWTLLQSEPDWRWMLRRDDSPWYPSMRLFRQPRLGDWRSVADRLLQALSTHFG